MMTSEAVKVVVRCRPMNKREKDLNCKSVIRIETSKGQCSIIQDLQNLEKPSTKNFFFDGSYDTNSTTENIYNSSTYPLVEGVSQGYNGTIFAYGQTGCGKSFTMQGVSDNPPQRGIIPRAFEHIFETIALSDKFKYLVHASYIEIYQEDVRDLLAKDIKAKLELKEHPDRGVYVAGLSMHKVNDVEQCEVLMNRGWKNRAIGATLMNADSSRSHSIFCISLEMVEEEEDHKGDGANKKQHIRAAKLNLVDLAGSERVIKTGSSGERLKEATKINLSLSALGNVISALVDGKHKHIPYRDSKLTRILQDSLGGNTKTLMVACISPADNNYDETLSTLRYANRAKNIQNKPKINEDPKDALLRQYQEEINKLKMMLEQQGAADFSMNMSQVQAKAIKEMEIKQNEIQNEKEKIKQEYEKLLMEKEASYQAEAADKLKYQKEMEKLKEKYAREMKSLDHQSKKISENPENDDISHVRLNADAAAVDMDNSVMIINQYGNLQLDGQSSMRSEDSLMSERRSTGKSKKASLSFSSPSTSSLAANRKLRQLPAMTNKDSMQTAEWIQTYDEVDSLSREELIKRLRQLKSSIVGGEERFDEEKKRKHQQNFEEAQRKLLRLHETKTKEEKAEDEVELLDKALMGNINKGIQMKERVIEKQREQIENLQREIEDLKDEFENDRTDYLDTIRDQIKQNALLQAMLERMQPGIRRDCNYFDLEQIKSAARWNEETGEWTLPSLKIEHLELPPAIKNGFQPNISTTAATNRLTSANHHNAVSVKSSRFDNKSPSSSRSSEESFHSNTNPNDIEQRYLARIAAQEDLAKSYFASNRADILLKSRSDRLLDSTMNHNFPSSQSPRSALSHMKNRRF